MKVLCVVLFAFIASAFAVHNAIKYVGTTVDAPTFAPPVIAFDGTCTPYSSTYSYAHFNYTFDAAGVWELSATSDYSIYVYIYHGGFDPLQPCSHMPAEASNDSPFTSIDVFEYFEVQPGTYTFVIAQSFGAEFAIHLTPTTGHGWTTEFLWNPSYNTSSGGECAQYSNEEPYGTFVWQHSAGSGFFDISAGVANNTGSFFYLSVYEGNITADRNLTDTCNNTDTGAIFLYGEYESGDAHIIPYFHFMNGTTYTVVISTGDGYTHTTAFGVIIQPTRMRILKQSPTWTQPSRSSSTTCEADTTYTATPWHADTFTTEGDMFFMFADTIPSSVHNNQFNWAYFDAVSYAYDFENVGTDVMSPITCSVLPGQNYLGYADTGSSTVLLVVDDAGTYTVVTSTWAAATCTNCAYYFLLWNGRNIHSSGPSATTAGTTGTTGTTGAAVSGGTTTASAATGATGTHSTGTHSTGTHSTGTAAGSGSGTTSQAVTTSSATTVAVSFFVFATVVLAMLL